MNGRAQAAGTVERNTRFVAGKDFAPPVRLAHGLAPLLRVLREAGHEIDPLLAAADIPRFAPEDPGFRLRVAQEMRFTVAALAQLDRSDAGLLVGQHYHMVMLGVLGLAAASAATVRELLRTLLRYPALSWGMCRCALRSDGTQASLQFEPYETAGEHLAFYVERDIACTVTLLRDMLGGLCPTFSVRLRHAAPADVLPYERFFGGRVRFGNACYEIRFAAADWERAPPQADPLSFRHYEQQCRRLSDTLLASLDYADVARSRLRVMVPMPSLGQLAAALRLSERSLQRRLTAAGTSFSELLREVRLEQARRILRRERMPLDEIAWRLGFEDPIAFSHAFKAWTGQAPRDYRRAQRSA